MNNPQQQQLPPVQPGAPLQQQQQQLPHVIWEDRPLLIGRLAALSTEKIINNLETSTSLAMDDIFPFIREDRPLRICSLAALTTEKIVNSLETSTSLTTDDIFPFIREDRPLRICSCLLYTSDAADE